MTATPLPFNSDAIDWQKMDDLVPAIIQHYETGAVLMLGYMNQEALAATLQHNIVTFYSRSKQRLWQKGETSGHYLKLIDLYLDCDQDALLILVSPQGPTCHLGTVSCFNMQTFPHWQFILELQQLLHTRKLQLPDNSYTSQLFSAGISRIAQKVGEEGVEVAIAAVSNDDALVSEAADLLFHLLVLLTAKSLTLSDVIQVLQQRR